MLSSAVAVTNLLQDSTCPDLLLTFGVTSGYLRYCCFSISQQSG